MLQFNVVFQPYRINLLIKPANGFLNCQWNAKIILPDAASPRRAANMNNVDIDEIG